MNRQWVFADVEQTQRFDHKATRGAILPTASDHASTGDGQHQAAGSARHPDIEESTLLFKIGVFATVEVRKKSLFAAG